MKADFFNQAMAASFAKESNTRSVSDMRLTTIVATVAFSLFAILDYLVYREHFLTLLIIRLVVILLSFIINLLTRFGFGQRRIRDIGMAEYLICSLAIILMINLTADTASPYYAGIIVIFIVFNDLIYSYFINYIFSS